MKTTKATGAHTVGPWRIDGDVLHSPDGGDIAIIDFNSVDYASEDGGEKLANARLIAAAPELLTALEKIYDWTLAPGSRPDPVVIQRIARSVIAKARGDT